MTAGAREGSVNWVRRLAARAQVEHFTAFILPGLEVARAHGIDLASVQLRVVPTPRHANVLLLIGELPPGLLRAACVVYAQMPRPRVIVALGSGSIMPLPAPDATGNLGQAGLIAAMTQLRSVFRTRAWSKETTSFQAAALQDESAEEAVDPHAGHHGMSGHSMPERAHGEGSMAGHSAMKMNETHEHDGMESGEPVDEPAHGGHMLSAHAAMDHGHDAGKQEEPHSEHQMSTNVSSVDDTPMETVASQNRDGDTATIMDDRETEHDSMTESIGGSMKMDMPGEMDHSSHGDGFMSMVMTTQDLPRSPDGLPMEWLEVPFGPFSPGLPGGLGLTFTLDGDAVARAQTRPGLARRNLEDTWRGPAAAFPRRLARLDPLAPVAYRCLAQLALALAAGMIPNEATTRQYVGALEWERAVSHLNWLASLASLLGDRWLEDRATRFHHALLTTQSIEFIQHLKGEVRSFVRHICRAPLLQRRLSKIGLVLEAGSEVLRGPVARGAGIATDSRSNDPAYQALDFAPALAAAGDANSRLQVRLEELQQSLNLVVACSSFHLPAMPPWEGASGDGTATVETPRGAATLQCRVRQGNVEDVTLHTPSTGHLSLVPAMTEGLEIGDALIAVASLDLSPWEIDR